MVEPHKCARLGGRYIARFGIALLVCIGVAALVVAVLLFRKSSSLLRTTVVLVGDPVVVWSQDRATKRVVRITLPKDAVVEGVHGYGMYALESLWSLGAIDRKDGEVLVRSIEEALGIPIQWFIGKKEEGKVTLGLSSLFEYLRGGYRTNLSLPEFIALVMDSSGMRADKITDVTITPDTALTSEQIADGSTRQVLDTSRVDVLLGTLFEDERIRKESLSVAVYNTTDMSTLGSRVARTLGHLGVFVVRVGNAAPEIGDCTVTANKDVLTTLTVAVIREVFACKDVEGAVDVADIEVRLGSAYQARFLPQ